MQLVLSGIRIDVYRKKIKNMHLHVKPPDGRVIISAPMRASNKAVETFARTNLDWIKKQIKKIEEQPPCARRQYVSGETLCIWGEPYFLTLEEGSKKNSFAIQGNRVILSMRGESTAAQREKYVREQYRILLKQEIGRLLPKWEQITGLHCESWHTKYMTTRWGTCNTGKKRLWFNVQLAQKPADCLEYVILHELAHTRVSNHGPQFVSIMDQYMPHWREVQKKLNESYFSHVT